MSLATLPELITFDSHNGDWSVYLEKIYKVFLDEVAYANLRFQGLPVKCQYRPATQEKHYGFWHLISEGETEEDRIPDLRRCERIRWIAYVIKNANSAAVSYWENKRGSNRHTVLWLEKESFIVILAKRRDYFLLKTAYVHNDKKAAKLRKERDTAL